MSPILLLLIAFAVMMVPMLMMSSRQRKAQRAQQEMLSQVGVGDEVRTHSGFYGLVVEEFDDTVVLESESGAQLKWARAAIAMRLDPADGTPVVPDEERGGVHATTSAATDEAPRTEGGAVLDDERAAGADLDPRDAAPYERTDRP